MKKRSFIAILLGAMSGILFALGTNFWLKREVISNEEK